MHLFLIFKIKKCIIFAVSTTYFCIIFNENQ